MSTKAEREAEVAKITLSNIPSIAEKQKESQAIYVLTGSWSSEKQIQLHKEAENLRMQLDKSYTGSQDGAGYNDPIMVSQNKNSGTTSTTPKSSSNSISSGNSVMDKTLQATVGMDVNGAVKVGMGFFVMLLVYQWLSR
jgi:hypothetical protein